MNNTLKQAIEEFVSKSGNPLEAIESIRALLHDLSPVHVHPVDHVRWVDVNDVEPNDYNPNSVARIEMGLLVKSIQHDGYTQPVVTIYDADRKKYVIVDGFHRYYVMKNVPAISATTGGMLPVVVIDKPVADRMASTVRHNRARGKHSVNGMAKLVFQMLDQGMSDAAVCNELGMEAEELLRLKHITGFSKLFENAEYRRAWETKNQIEIRLAHAKRVAKSGDGNG